MSHSLLKHLRNLFFKILFTAFIIILGVIAFIYWRFLPPDQTIRDVDYHFSGKVKGALISANGNVKVSDLYPGNWEKVCHFSNPGLSLDLDVRKVIANDVSQVNILDASDPYLTDVYNESALIFVFENGITIFKITPDYMLYNGTSENRCVEKNKAFLKAGSTRSQMKNHQSDYIEAVLIEE